jgi:hypothetical protein
VKYHSCYNYLRLIIFVSLIMFNVTPGDVFASGDTLTITTTPADWFGLVPGISYLCIADDPDNRIIIQPFDSFLGEPWLTPGQVNIIGIPGAQIELKFTLPSELVPDWWGTLSMKYTNQSASVIDSRNPSEPYAWFNPSQPFTITLDTVGTAKILFCGNPEVSNDAPQAGSFWGYGLVTAEYIDSLRRLLVGENVSIRDSARLEFFASIYDCDGCLVAEPDTSVILFSNLRPGINYVVYADTILSISPINPNNPEIIEQNVIDIHSMAGGAGICAFLTLPQKLLPRTGFGEIKLSYDSTSFAAIDPLTGSVSRRCIDCPNELYFESNQIGTSQLRITGNPNVSADVLEGDTLYGTGKIVFAYCGLTSNKNILSLNRMLSLHNGVILEFQAIINSPSTYIASDDFIIVPKSFALFQNHPNPFNPVTKIRYQVPVQSEISLRVYNVLGMEVAILADGMINAGTHEAEWDASGFPSGVYFYRLGTGQHTEVKKMILTK